MSPTTVDASLPIVPIDLRKRHAACKRKLTCGRYIANIEKRLGDRYITEDKPFDKQVVSAVLDVRDLGWDDYMSGVKKRYKGNVLRDARKAERAGFICRPFARKVHLPDLVEINHSKEKRCGGPMREAYLKSLKEMGGPPKKTLPVPEPDCPLHYDIWWGVFEPVEGYTQGNVVTNERMIAYIDFRRVGNFALYSLILGHGDYLKYGIMYRLHFQIVEWILSRSEPTVQGLDFLVYAGFNQGGEGLQLWKKKTLYEPGYLVFASS